MGVGSGMTGGSLSNAVSAGDYVCYVPTPARGGGKRSKSVSLPGIPEDDAAAAAATAASASAAAAAEAVAAGGVAPPGAKRTSRTNSGKDSNTLDCAGGGYTAPPTEKL